MQSLSIGMMMNVVKTQLCGTVVQMMLYRDTKLYYYLVALCVKKG